MAAAGTMDGPGGVNRPDKGHKARENDRAVREH